MGGLEAVGEGWRQLSGGKTDVTAVDAATRVSRLTNILAITAIANPVTKTVARHKKKWQKRTKWVFTNAHQTLKLFRMSLILFRFLNSIPKPRFYHTNEAETV